MAVWAPKSATVSVRILGDPARLVPLRSMEDGYHRGPLSDLPAGARYRLVLDDGRELADPASRSQPDGVTGPSAVFDPSAHRWDDAGFVAKPLWQHVIYEAHIGTLTPAGSFDSAIDVLDELADLGITAVEPLPVAQFAGTRNWGYDGVFPYAVQHSYGGPAAFQRFVDAAHQRGIAVVLDVVYNHVGPEGNVLDAYGPVLHRPVPDPVGCGHQLRWTRLRPGPQVLRGERTHLVPRFPRRRPPARCRPRHRRSDRHPVPGRAVRGHRAARHASSAAGSSSSPRARTTTPGSSRPLAVGGLGLDAQWNDDFHHALHATLTGERLGYYADFGDLGQLARSMSQGFVYQGQYSRYRSRRHGAASTGIEPERFVLFAQNHDHVGNRPQGDRLASIVGAGALRLAAAVLLLSPGVPLLFMGEEYGETAPFAYFVDHADSELRQAVRRGRAAGDDRSGVDGRDRRPARRADVSGGHRSIGRCGPLPDMPSCGPSTGH